MINLHAYAVDFEKADSIKNGDMVSWQSSGGKATGRVEHIMREGVLGIPDSSFSIKAEKDDPAVLIRIYKDGEETETLVGHKMSTLNKTQAVKKHGEHDQSSHGSWSSNPANGDDPAAMDMMNDKPYKLPKLTPAQRKIYSRVSSPASSAYVDRPFGGVEFARTWRLSTEPAVTGYKPDPENNPS